MTSHATAKGAKTTIFQLPMEIFRIRGEQTHSVQAVPAGPSWNLPWVHVEQRCCPPTRAIVPGSHVLGTDDPSMQKWPTGHRRHSAAEARWEPFPNVPALHAEKRQEGG
eukprot:5217500-Prymnesium_polylepis.1